jgi:hypothetical protein
MHLITLAYNTTNLSNESAYSSFILNRSTNNTLALPQHDACDIKKSGHLTLHANERIKVRMVTQHSTTSPHYKNK